MSTKYQRHLKNHPTIKLLESSNTRERLHRLSKSVDLERYSREGILNYINREALKQYLNELGITYEEWVRTRYQKEADLNYLTPEQRDKEDEAWAECKPKLKRIMGRIYGGQKRKLDINLLKRLYCAEKAKELKLPLRKNGESRKSYMVRVKSDPFFSCYEFHRPTSSFKLSTKVFLEYIVVKPEFRPISIKTLNNQISIIKNRCK